MNYSEALAFAFRDPDWVKKLAIGGLVAFAGFYFGLVFLLGFFLVGYYVGIIRNVIRGKEHPLPDWSDLGKLFVDGLLGTIISLFYFLLIGGLCAVSIVSVANSYLPDYEMALWIVVISLLTLLSLTIFINYGLMQFAATENFGAAFRPGSLFALLRHRLGDFLAITVFSLVLNGILFLAGLAILSPFTNFWGMAIQAHLFGQCARDWQPVTPAVQSA